MSSSSSSGEYGAVGVPLLLPPDTPWMYSTRSRTWRSMLVVISASALASGPVASWPTLEPLVREAGVFKNAEDPKTNFDICYAVSMCFLFASSLPSGILMDKCGGRACGVVGALMASVGLLLMGAATTFPAQWDWLMFYGYPMATAGGMINSFCMYTFIWLLPDRANLVTGIAGGIASLSDTCALLAVWLHDIYGVPIAWFFFGLSVLALAAAVVSQLVVPSLEFSMECARLMAPEAILAEEAAEAGAAGGGKWAGACGGRGWRCGGTQRCRCWCWPSRRYTASP